MSATVAAVLTGPGPTPAGPPAPTWGHGPVHDGRGSVACAADATRRAVEGGPDAVLWWDPLLGPPPEPAPFLARPDDVWHAGITLGQSGRPTRLRAVAPAWMLDLDPGSEEEGTSWRLSLRACLARARVVEALGGPDPAFETLSGAALELGHRWITLGARPRHVPDLVNGQAVPDPPPTDPDGLRLVERRLDARWARLAAFAARPRLRSAALVRAIAAEPRVRPDDREPPSIGPPVRGASVAVVVPTVDRYHWLDTVLAGLAVQTYAPAQVIVVDQTPAGRRRPVRHPSLPLRVLVRDRAGQSSARNAALEDVDAELVLFVDDDDEIPPDLIERHVGVIEHRGVDASCGVAREPGDEPPSGEFRRFRVADVFPTGNTMVRIEALESSGWFDPAFDRGVRADHDLGTRLHRAGARMVLTPDIEVVHHRAPVGGLRTHGARRVTAASSRRSILERQAISATEVYLWQRHHPDAVSAAIRLRLIGNLRGAGSRPRRALRALTQLVLLPAAWAEARRAAADASDLLDDRSPIPHAPEAFR